MLQDAQCDAGGADYVKTTSSSEKLKCIAHEVSKRMTDESSEEMIDVIVTA